MCGFIEDHELVAYRYLEERATIGSDGMVTISLPEILEIMAGISWS